jgi:Kef-type K+ transport system membrane component KefB
MDLSFLPKLPLPISGLALFGIILLAGLVGGRLARGFGWVPKITGYIAIGAVFGSSGFNLLTPEMVEHGRVFVDIALGLILFELGRHLDLSWIGHERGLLLTGVLECVLSFLLPFFVLVFLGHPRLVSAEVAMLGIATGPAVTLLVVKELGAEGQVTRRLLSLTALNNIVAIIGFTALWAFVHRAHQASTLLRAAHPLYLLVGSIALGFAMHLLTITLAAWLGKQRSAQFIMLVGVVVFAIGAAQALHLSVPLTLLALGIMSKNLDPRYRILPLEFGHASQLFYIILFVIIGANLRFDQFVVLGWALPAFIAARFVGKTLAIFVFARLSRLTPMQAGMLSLALLPMTGPALAMTLSVSDVYPQFGAQLAAMVVAAIAALDLIGPIATQFALRRVGEANPDKVRERD